jgi:hypothetical protein
MNPHFLSLIAIRPLEFRVTENHPPAHHIAAMRLISTDIEASPALIRFTNHDVAVAFFDGDGHVKALREIFPEQKALDFNHEGLIPEEVVRVPFPHLKNKGESNVERLIDVANHHEPICSFNKKSFECH